MFHTPLLGYSGISVILSHRGRHDNERLLTARGGEYFDQCLTLASKQLGLQIPVTRFNLFIKELADPQPIPTGTKVVLLLDSKAQRCFIPDLTLNEARGYCYQLPNSQEIYIASYSPEEAMDRKFIYSGADDEDGEDDDDPESGKEKDHSPTRRKNWKYWLCQDIKKALDISVNGYKPLLKLAKFQIYLPSTEVIHKLNSLTNEHFYFDIETDPFFRVTVFSFSTDCDTIWTVPLIRYDGSEAYDRLQICRILVALAGVFARNAVVIHNCLFDLLILLWRYKIPPPLDWRRIKDTMVLQHRLQPEVEKSLGHCGSYLTHEEYHKNQIIYVPKTRDQEQRLWLYNARDVGMLAIIYPKLQKLGEHKGAQGSFDRAHRLLLPYLLQTVVGCNVDLGYKSKTFDELERKKAQYQRMAKILCGYDIEKLGSWQRVAKYLYEYKGLPKPAPKFVDGVFKYEELTASATLYKLRSQYNIPLIDLLLHYRADGKESGFLKFNCWTPLVDQHRGRHNPTRFTSSDSITGTNTLRNASRMLFDFWGSNKQNVKKKLRAVVVADPGKDLVQTDQAGAEALVVAYLAPRGQYRALFENGIKSHVFVAMHVFQKEWEVLMEQPLTDFINSPINKLTKVPGWKKLEKFIKDSDNWIASKRYYYIAKMICHASVDKDTEVLTRKGWVKISQVDDATEILVHNATTKISHFETPKFWSRYFPDKSLVKLDSSYAELLATRNHRVLCKNNQKLEVKYAEDLIGTRTVQLPINTNKKDGVKFDHTWLQFAIAIQADGHINNQSGRIDFHFVKKRKVENLKRILETLKLKYDVWYWWEKVVISVKLEWLGNLLDLVFSDKNSKTFSVDFFLSLDQDCLDLILNEVIKWDGSISSSRQRYFSANKINCETIQTLAHICGRRASIVNWPSSNGNSGWCVTITCKGACDFSKLKNATVVSDYKDLVYSPSVSTGFYLIRKNGKISITGNSNYGMKGPTFQINVLKKSEGKIIISKKEADFFLGTYHYLFPEIRLWHSKVQQQLQTQGKILTNLFGDQREFMGQWDDTLFKEAYAFVPQSTVGMLTNIAIGELQEKIDNNEDNIRCLGVDILANGHDAILSQCWQGCGEYLAKEQEKLLAKTFFEGTPNQFTMKSESSIGPRWDFKSYNVFAGSSET